MAWVLNDIVLGEFKQEYLEQSILNTLFWEIVAVVGPYLIEIALAELADIIKDALTSMQNDSLVHIEQNWLNITNGIDVELSTSGGVGLIPTVDPAPSYLCVGMKKAVPSRLTRPGSIRVAGMNDSFSDGNQLTVGMEDTSLLVGAILEADQVVAAGPGATLTFSPRVVGRTAIGGFDLARVNPILGIGVPRLTTQTSRKPVL